MYPLGRISIYTMYSITLSSTVNIVWLTTPIFGYGVYVNRLFLFYTKTETKQLIVGYIYVTFPTQSLCYTFRILALVFLYLKVSCCFAIQSKCCQFVFHSQVNFFFQRIELIVVWNTISKTLFMKVMCINTAV